MKIIDRSELRRRIEERSMDDISSGRVGGIALAVRQSGELLYENTFGAAKKDSLFRIASMTKPITATAALILMEKGLLSLDDPIEKYFPCWGERPIVKMDGDKLVTTGTASVKPTVLNILNHTSGIGGGEIGVVQHEAMSKEEKADLYKAVEYYARAGIQFEPGTEALYSGTASFSVLTAIIEKITDMKYGDFLKKNIFDPLGMTDTSFEPNWERVIGMHNYVDGKSVKGDTNEGCVFADFPISHQLGGAGLVSTVDDYCKFAEMLLNGGNGIISPESVKLMSTPSVPYSVQKRNKRWGLSVKVVSDESYQSLPVGAFGWSGAYGTHFWVDPENKITAVYMKNSLYDGGGDAITAKNFEWDVTLSMK